MTLSNIREELQLNFDRLGVWEKYDVQSLESLSLTCRDQLGQIAETLGDPGAKAVADAYQSLEEFNDFVNKHVIAQNMAVSKEEALKIVDMAQSARGKASVAIVELNKKGI